MVFRSHGSGDGGQADEALLDSIYRRYVGEVTAYVLRRCAPDEAADVVSETFVVVWRRIADVPDEPAVRPWLLAIARRVLANQRRGIRRRSALVDRAASYLLPHLQTAPAVDIDGHAELVKQALQALSAADQELMMLVAWEELSPTEISTVLNMSPGNVRKRLFRARKRLRAEVARLEEERPTESGHLPNEGDTRRPAEEVPSP